MRLVFIAMIGIGYPSLTLAGWGSGGGSAIVCYFEEFKHHMPKSFVGELPKEALAPEHIESITQYDLYYAQHKERSSREFDEVFNVFEGTSKSLFEIVVPKRDETLKSYFHRILGVVKLLVPRLGEIIEDSHKSFDVITKHKGIPPVPDFTDHLKEDRPDRCTVAQMARQRTLGKVHELDIDTRLFFHKKHSTQSQVTVFVHEDVYLYGRTQRRHESADETHALVAQLLNGKLNYDRLMRAAGNFGIDYEDSMPFVRVAQRIDAFNSRLLDVSARFDRVIAGSAEQLLNHSAFKTMPIDYPNPNTFIESLASQRFELAGLTEEKVASSRVSDYFRLVELYSHFEEKILGPLVVIRGSEFAIEHFYKSRRSLRKKEEKKIKEAEPFLPQMERYIDEYTPMSATLVALLDPLMKLYAETLSEELLTGIDLSVENIDSFIGDEAQEEANRLWRDYVQTRVDWLTEARAAWKTYRAHAAPSMIDRLRKPLPTPESRIGAIDDPSDSARKANRAKTVLVARLRSLMPRDLQEENRSQTIQDKMREVIR